MCINCWREAGSPKIVNEKTKAAAGLVTELYDLENGGAGGYGHIVFDDWNLQDSNVDWCLKYCDNVEPKYNLGEEIHEASVKALKAFKELSVEERYSALALQDGFIEQS